MREPAEKLSVSIRQHRMDTGRLRVNKRVHPFAPGQREWAKREHLLQGGRRFCRQRTSMQARSNEVRFGFALPLDLLPPVNRKIPFEIQHLLMVLFAT